MLIKFPTTFFLKLIDNNRTMELIRKYLLFVFLIENVVCETIFFSGKTLPVFYVLLSLGLLLFFSPLLYTERSKQSFSWMIWICLLYILYFSTFGFVNLSSQNAIYVVAKISTFIIIVVGLAYDIHFYFKRFFIWLSYLLLSLFFFGFLFSNVSIEGRYSFGLVNPNEAGILAVYTFGIIFYMWKMSWKASALLVFCLFIILMTGSRNSILMLSIFILFRFNISMRNVMLLFLSLLVVVTLISYFDINFIGIERLSETLEGSSKNDRTDVHNAARWMIAHRPWTGWGFYQENIGYAARLTKLGAHNGYLTTIKALGYVFGLTWIGIILLKVSQSIKLYKTNNKSLRFHLALVLSYCSGAYFEDFFVGVHEITTNVFFVSLCILCAYPYYKRKRITKLRVAPLWENKS